MYEPYARRFSTFVVGLYLDSYPLVDDNTRGKMEEMLLTWRTGSPTGKELFGVQQQMAIERGVWGAGGDTVSSMFIQSFDKFLNSRIVKHEVSFRLRTDHKISSPQRASIYSWPEGTRSSGKPVRYPIAKSYRGSSPGT